MVFMSPITLTENYIADPELAFDILMNDLDWERRSDAPRYECWMNDFNAPYTYGRFAGERTYQPKPWNMLALKIRDRLLETTGVKYEGCFLNRYDNGQDHLGWHADDSPMIDATRPIAIVSLGAMREIWFCPQADKRDFESVWMRPGSLLVMNAGMQQTHYHRIPKASRPVGPRISLTFRGLLLDN